MIILLLNPPCENTVKEYADDSGKDFIDSDDFGYFPPLGLLYILSSAEKKYPEHDYHFIDCIAEKISYPLLANKIEELKPDFVGITSFTISLLDVIKSAETVRKTKPNTHICLGGHHPTAFPYEACQLPQFDSVVVGEAEYAFPELVNCVANNIDFTTIKGVYTKESIELFVGNQIRDRRFLNHVIVPPAYVEDVDDIPSPNRKYLQHINYSSIIGLTGKLATMITTRGCPYKCTFCDVPYKTYRQRNIELVMDEIEECLALGYEEFHFYDDLFNITHQKIMDFCDAIERRKLKIVWDFRGRVNGITFESLKRAKEVGLRMISFGVETGSDIGLKTLKKGSNLQQVEKAFEWCRILGIQTVANYMIGLPHEKSASDVRDNVNFLLKLNPDYAQFGILCLYPHTQVHKDAIALGIAEAGIWEKFSLEPYDEFRVEHWTQYLSVSELVKLQKESYRRFYFRPKYILNSIRNTNTMHELKSKVGGVLKLLSIK
jgi:anaerobic magnesium-protoporphyrin IX monomethyl ester cyclase